MDQVVLLTQNIKDSFAAKKKKLVPNFSRQQQHMILSDTVALPASC